MLTSVRPIPTHDTLRTPHDPARPPHDHPPLHPHTSPTLDEAPPPKPLNVHLHPLRILLQQPALRLRPLRPRPALRQGSSTSSSSSRRTHLARDAAVRALCGGAPCAGRVGACVEAARVGPACACARKVVQVQAQVSVPAPVSAPGPVQASAMKQQKSSGSEGREWERDARREVEKARSKAEMRREASQDEQLKVSDHQSEKKDGGGGAQEMRRMPSTARVWKATASSCPRGK
ncbi:hypothetical protein ONZ51_g13522 [Trametes cubensis]|uniref:Uncharacterized protein n=1 Tax=Trametes cubensis TaxID=1111947 RepID=A0AAD7TF67_9APHY|nr:hypothetical protein ONZ51_g13522 [Trametes cubensis]